MYLVKHIIIFVIVENPHNRVRR